VAGVGAAWLITGSSVARADVAEDKAMAQTLFDHARALVHDRKFAEACPKLAQSLRLDPGTGTRLWLADCYENNGQTASAWVHFKEAAAAAALEKDARASVARRRAASLEPRLTKLVIVVPPEAEIEGLELKRDGVVVDPVELGIASPVDPGAHRLSATAAGREPWRTTIELPAQATTITVRVPPLAALEAPAAVSEVAPAATVAGDVVAPGGLAAAPSPGANSRIAGVSLAGVGVLSLGVGAFLGLTASATYDDSNRDGRCLPTNECNAAGKDLRSRAGGLATASTVAFGVGGAALAVGAVLFFTAPRGAKAAMSVLPLLGPRIAGLEIGRRW
jgi:serine/threonine-protein kinase